MSSHHDDVNAATIEAIKDSAYPDGRIAHRGLALQAIACTLDMSASARYHYFASLHDMGYPTMQVLPSARRPVAEVLV